MGILTCPACGVAIADSASACHTCSAILPAGRSAGVTGQGGNAQDAAPGRSTAALATRRREARTASLALQGAAWILVLRGTLLPILISHASTPRYDEDGNPVPAVAMPFDHTDPDDVRLTSYAAAAAFVGLCLWARKNPLLPAVTGLVLYAGLCLPDLIHGTGLIEKGVIGKLITFLAIARAVAAGIVYRLTPVPDDGGGPGPAPI